MKQPCPRQNQLSDFLDGQLDPTEHSAITLHLNHCESCTNTLADLKEIIGLAHAYVPETVPDSLWQALQPKIKDPPKLRRTRPWLVPTVLAAAILLGTLLWFDWFRSDGLLIPEKHPDLVQHASDFNHGYADEVARLEELYYGQAHLLDSQTRFVLEQSLTDIERALERARQALQSDPLNPLAVQIQSLTRAQKITLLQGAIYRAENLNENGG